MNLKELKELIELVSEKGFAEFEIERQGFRLRISRFKEQAAASAQSAASSGAPAIASTPLAGSTVPPANQHEISQSGAPLAAQPAGVESANQVTPPYILTSPIVGTFYRSPSPDAPSFVEVGSRVKKGQVLCIIEAMKLMNEIESDVDGEVVQIYPQNAQAVEYGEPLFGIRVE
jgi:acetyl-CoA carboxylase biotin carboxyl carrier protein